MWKRWWEIPTCFSSKNFPSLKPHLLGLLLWTIVFSHCPASQRFLVSLTVSCQGGQSAARSLEQSASGVGSRSQSWEWFTVFTCFQFSICSDFPRKHWLLWSRFGLELPNGNAISRHSKKWTLVLKNQKASLAAYVSSILEGLPDSQRNQAEWHWNHTLIIWSQKKGMHVRIHETSTVSNAKQEMWTTFPNILR